MVMENLINRFVKFVSVWSVFLLIVFIGLVI